MNNLKWLSQDEFSPRIQKSFTEKVQEIYFCDFKVKSNILKRIIPTMADDYVAPWTDPGPCLKWYGLFSDGYFILTSRLGNYETADVQLLLPEFKSIDWRIFKNEKLLPFFVKRLIWIKGSVDSVSSLFCIDKDNLAYEFYRAKDENDAEELKKYLVENIFQQKLFIANPENLDLTWIVETDGKIVARYTSRYTCEKFAVSKSKENDLPYIVKCESDSKYPQKIFQKGILLK